MTTIPAGAFAALFECAHQGVPLGTVKRRDPAALYPAQSGRPVSIYRHGFAAEAFGADLLLEIEDTSWNLTLPGTSESLVEMAIDGCQFGFIISQDSWVPWTCFHADIFGYRRLIYHPVYSGDLTVLERIAMMMRLSGVDFSEFHYSIMPRNSVPRRDLPELPLQPIEGSVFDALRPHVKINQRGL